LLAAKPPRKIARIMPNIRQFVTKIQTAAKLCGIFADKRRAKMAELACSADGTDLGNPIKSGININFQAILIQT
jgi:hypothetical protein